LGEVIGDLLAMGLLEEEAKEMSGMGPNPAAIIKMTLILKAVIDEIDIAMRSEAAGPCE
jgi:hypothetical protein